ncbi:MAG: NADH:ubiquinone reductase (Na(+)-transporting) subunit C [Bacteroidales bacterium]|nr:NADH:ubiquinone reductase (Na(+)-transporting) subunit C [Bacteroidales bacterium]
MYSNRYIFIYSSVMVIIVAAILSTAAMVLKPFQEKNVRTAKIIDILTSVNIESEKSNAEDLYSKHIIMEGVINPKGEIISIYKNNKFEKGDIRAFEINLKEEQQKEKEFKAGKIKEQPNYPLFICNKNGETFYIIPLLGKGLWGPIWGNIALKSDLNTVIGVTFAHKSETPGLGAEIDKKPFQVQFEGRQIFDNNGNFTSIKVVKGGVDMLPEKDRIHGVDAITGGTITSTGVSEMLKDCLENYIPYIKKSINN